MKRISMHTDQCERSHELESDWPVPSSHDVEAVVQTLHNNQHLRVQFCRRFKINSSVTIKVSLSNPAKIFNSKGKNKLATQQIKKRTAFGFKIFHLEIPEILKNLFYNFDENASSFHQLSWKPLVPSQRSFWKPLVAIRTGFWKPLV
jgi:hypothetical protein